MFAALVKLLPALRFPELGVLNFENEQLAIESCVSAVQIYFPCDSAASYTNHTCLCEQYLWSAACIDNHASDPTSHPDYAVAETRWSDYCRAAGSMGTELVQQKHQLQRRQIGSFLSNIGGAVTSLLAQPSEAPSPPPPPPPPITTSKNNPTSSTPPPRSRASTLATMTSPSASQSPSQAPTPSSKSSSSSTTSDSTEESSTPSSTPSTTPSPSVSPTPSSAPAKSSGPSTGTIVGAVLGSLALLSLLIAGSIFLLNRIKHKKQQNNNNQDTKPFPRISTDSEHGMVQHAAVATATDAQSPASYANSPAVAKPLPHPPAVAGAVGGKRVLEHEYAKNSAASGVEMSTGANVWELDSKECPAPVELDAGPVVSIKDEKSSVQVRSVSGQGSSVIPRKPVGVAEEKEMEKGKENHHDELFFDL